MIPTEPSLRGKLQHPILRVCLLPSQISLAELAAGQTPVSRWVQGYFALAMWNVGSGLVYFSLAAPSPFVATLTTVQTSHSNVHFGNSHWFKSEDENHELARLGVALQGDDVLHLGCWGRAGDWALGTRAGESWAVGEGRGGRWTRHTTVGNYPAVGWCQLLIQVNSILAWQLQSLYLDHTGVHCLQDFIFLF